ncbi:putative signal peptide protein [Puccinia sorghi]|uniref:Putative signal peptide protein n=1 Tax=Puccinia sorghi TaxID=27349 RepID=A0A0L6UNI9_9BASI|nr:putative signal peptide protein [Puccinia sorghi]
MQTCGVLMAAWLEHAACQLQVVEQVIFEMMGSVPGPPLLPLTLITGETLLILNN